MPVELLAVLQAHGWIATTIAAQGLRSARDRQVLAHCRDHGFVLLTLDRDFARPEVAGPRMHAGIVVLRPRSPRAATAQDLLVKALPALPNLLRTHRVLVIEESAIHSRP